MRRAAALLLLASLVIAVPSSSSAAPGGVVAGRFHTHYTATGTSNYNNVKLVGAFTFHGQTWVGLVTGRMVRNDANNTYFPFTLSGMNPVAGDLTMNCSWLGYQVPGTLGTFVHFIWRMSCAGSIAGGPAESRLMVWNIYAGFDPTASCSQVPCTTAGTIAGIFKQV